MSLIKRKKLSGNDYRKRKKARLLEDEENAGKLNMFFMPNPVSIVEKKGPTSTDFQDSINQISQNISVRNTSGKKHFTLPE